MSIEKYLVLNKYLLSLFGVNDFRDLQEKMKDAPVGIDSDGRTHFVNILRSSFDNKKIPEITLLRYDANIQNYVRQINYRREPVNLKYFQYLAVLFTEIVLDNLKNRKVEFLYELNKFLEDYKKEEAIDILDQFTESDLNKLAFWMATGSGKTLIMHINYYQFFKHKLFSPDNIILITPNEGLSKQHFEELQKSGVPCKLYEGSLTSSSVFRDEDEVLVIEMTKFVEEKNGGGVTLPITAFEGRNLVFVDEGHKGRKVNKEHKDREVNEGHKSKETEEQTWGELRDRLAENGFVFEYSATFGQILSVSKKNMETLKRYAKSIVFDYSYKYFYLDGYGKDFLVLNAKESKLNDQEFQETMFVANMLSFYEQLLVYEENKDLAKEYNIEKPLWIFVGTTVTGEKGESDVIQIVKFIRRAIQDEEWVNEKIKSILNKETYLRDENNRDIFEDKFRYIRDKGFKLDDLYKRIFGGKGQFSIYEIKNAQGEFGLKVGDNNYFGVINIGNVSDFKKQLEEEGISVEQDAISGSLFDAIKTETSPINILIGSKKFIEGWDTWRVSSMGLLNIGKGQGPQIIQLFGRGVRLKGKGMSLKRSGDKGPIEILETLNIYGIKADYLNKFLEAIRREEVEFETIEIPIKPLYEERWNELYTLTKDDKKRFEEERVLKLELDSRISPTIALLQSFSMYSGREIEGERSIGSSQIKMQVEEMKLPEDVIDLLDWGRISEEIYNFKTAKGYWNLIFDIDGLRNLLLSSNYKILTSSEKLEVKNQNDLTQVENIALLVIKKYIDQFYRKHAKRFETENMKYSKVNRQLTLFAFEKAEDKYSYTVQVDKREKKLIEEIKKLANDFDRLIREDSEILPRIYFDNHLYVPILLQSKKIDKISPTGLVESEKRFISDLREYLKKNRAKFSGVEIYLLRNYPRSGVGFFNLSGFYPDFIMWIKKNNKQTIVFIDPKGLEHTKGLDDEKIELHNGIKELEKKLGRDDVVLESFILSQTTYEKLIEGRTSPPAKEEYIDNHVLFLEDKDWVERLFDLLMGR